MKVLTITQPWASLLVWEEKLLETRSWWTDYRGAIAIHSSKGMPNWAQDVMAYEPFRSAIERHVMPCKGELFGKAELPRGMVLGTCDLVNVVRVGGNWKQKLGARLTEKELSFGDYTEGRYVWVIENMKPLEHPFETRGALGLWDYKEEIC